MVVLTLSVAMLFGCGTATMPGGDGGGGGTGAGGAAGSGPETPWVEVTIPATSPLTAIWGSAANDVWAVGGAGAMTG